MSSKRFRTDVSQFLDLEAADQRSSGSSDSSYDTDPDDEFYEDTGELGISKSSPPIRLSDIKTIETDAAHLEKQAAEIKNRYNSNIRNQNDVVHLPEYPTATDAPIWRVRVRNGAERDVVFAILQKVLLFNFTTNILCAFMRDSISGSVYIESLAIDDVYQVLSEIPGVLRTQDQLPRCISINDRVPLLEMTDRCSIASGSWVRIKKRGKYHNDLAFVLDFDNHLMDVQVALIPRIHLTQKRSHRPAASLFELEAVKHFYGAHSVEQRNQILVFQKGEYKNGLLERSFGIENVSDRNVNPTPSELTLFTQCSNSLIVDAAYREMVRFRADDRIEIIAGQLRGLRGRLADIDERGTVIVDSTIAIQPQAVCTNEICKKFQLGDFVHVISGEHQGSEGFIVGLDSNSATLYCLPCEQVYSTVRGQELHLDLVHIDFDPKTPSMAPQSQRLWVFSTSADLDKTLMYTGRDPWKDMEVIINAGECKSHVAVVLSTMKIDNKIFVNVRTTTKVENVNLTFEMKDVTHLQTGLNLLKAQWVPKTALTPRAVLPPQYRAKTPPPSMSDTSSNLHESELESTPFEPAWDPRSRLYEDSNRRPLQPGEWLINPQFVNKRLDVRIMGTVDPPWRNGHYENQIGFIILKKPVKSADDSIPVKVGYTQGRVWFRARHLSPEITTEQSGPYPERTHPALPLVNSVGARVIIIGADLLGNLAYIGEYGLIIDCPYRLEDGQVCVQIINGENHAGCIGYYAEMSLCRSLSS